MIPRSCPPAAEPDLSFYWRRLALAGALAAAVSFMPAPLLADDRAPTSEERRAIEVLLKANGFSSWGTIVLVDDTWSVTNVTARDGQRFVLQLSNLDFAILGRRQAP